MINALRRPGRGCARHCASDDRARRIRTLRSTDFDGL